MPIDEIKWNNKKKSSNAKAVGETRQRTEETSRKQISALQTY